MTEPVPIRVFDLSLNLLGEVDDYLFASFTRKWHSNGEFNIQINTNSSGASLLQKNRIILFGSDPNLSGIIKHREITLGEAGKESEVWTISGYSLGGLCKQRITKPDAAQAYITSTSEAVETCMRTLVDKCLITADSHRVISGLSLDTDSLRGDTITHKSRYKNLANELESLSKLSGLGWEIIPDFTAGTMKFKVFSGVDRVYGQSVNPPVIFSPEFDAIKTQTFRESDLGFSNYIYVGGQGEGAARSVELVNSGSSNGYEVSEHFQDARDVATQAELITRGNQTLAELDTEKLFEATINEFGSFTYKTDWDLGDIVTIQNKDWDETLNTQIISVTESFSSTGRAVEVGLGNQFPNLIQQLKQKLGNFDNEIGR